MDIAVDLREYEFAFLLKEEGDISALLNILHKSGAEIISQGTLKKITLAYPINKLDQANFGYLYMRLLPSSLKDLEKVLENTPAVLRSLILSKPFVEQPSPEAQAANRASKREATPREAQPTSSLPLSNEDLERKIDEILK